MPKLHHQNKSISPVKARAKIKLERNLGPEVKNLRQSRRLENVNRSKRVKLFTT
jgi:hypothetical protein